MPHYEPLRALIERLLSYYRIPGCALAVLAKDTTEYLHFGFADVEQKTAFTEDTVSGIASCTKSMTAYLCLRLAEQGKLCLDEPIHNYLPDFLLWDEQATREATVRDLLCHRTGIGGHDGTWPDDSITRQEFLRRLRYLEPNEPFRTKAQYSNVLYAALGAIVEEVSGSRWEDLLEKEIFRPLGMEHSYGLLAQAQAEGAIAASYYWSGGLRRFTPWNIDMAGACGSVMSSVRDMEKWLRLQLQYGAWQGGQLLAKEYFTEGHRPQIAIDFPRLAGGTSLGYALGWRVVSYRGHEVQQHTGKIEGYSAFQFYLPQEGVGAVYLQNLHAPTNPFIFAVQGALLDYFLGYAGEDWAGIYTDELAAAPEEMYHHLEFNYLPQGRLPESPPELPLSYYTGSYVHPGYGCFRIVHEKGKLWLHERDVLYRPLRHLSGNLFAAENVKEDTDLYALPLEFLRTREGDRVKGFTLPMEPKVPALLFLKET